MSVECIEHKKLAKALFENTEEGDYIDVTYMNAVATVYSKLDKFKNAKEDFDEELSNDIMTQLYQLESDICQRAVKNFLKKSAKKNKTPLSIFEAREVIKNSIPKIPLSKAV